VEAEQATRCQKGGGVMLTLFLHPKPKPTPRHYYAYDVSLNGRVIVSGSRDPELDASRALRANGLSGRACFVDANTGKPRSYVTIEKAAKLRTFDDKRGLGFERWKALEPLAVRGHSPEAQEQASGEANTLRAFPNGRA
jgi:hypothetical protein